MSVAAALHKLTRARAALVVTQPFWGVLALNMRLVDEPGLGTMATDGESLFFDPAFVLSLSDPELRGVVAHEVEHVARLHHTRRGRRNPKLFNIAADFAINPGLLAGGFKLPAGGLNDPKYANMSAEAIYATLAKDEAAKPKPQPGNGAPSPDQQGSPQAGGAGDPAQSKQPGDQGRPAPAAGSPSGDPGEGQTPGKPSLQSGESIGAGKPGAFGQVRDAPGGAAGRAEAEAKAQQNVRQAAMVAKAQGAGKLPGFVQEIIAELDKPRVDWRATLRRFADESANRETCWTRPNRRFAGSSILLPGAESVTPSHLVALVDTSGSLDARDLAAFGGEIQAMLDESAVDRVSIVYCDTRVNRVETAEAGDVFKMKADGRGGTCFAPAFAWAEENAPDASAIVYLTDMQASDWAQVKEPATPVLWAVTGGGSRRPPFGETITLDRDA